MSASKATSQSLLSVFCLIALCFPVVFGQAFPDVTTILARNKEMQKMDVKTLFESKGLNFKDVKSLVRNEEELTSIIQNKMADVIGSAQSQTNQNGESVLVLADDRLVSERCANDWLMYIRDIRDGVPYARKMWVSRGNPLNEKTLYTLSLKDFGDIWLCQDNHPNATGYPPFSGQYCSSYIRSPYPNVALVWGSCFPSTCSRDEIQAVSDAILLTIPSVEEPFIRYDCVGPEPWLTADIVMLVVLSLFAVLVLVGTAYEVFLHERVLQKMVIKQKRAVPNSYEEVSTVITSEKGTSTTMDQTLEAAIEIGEETAKVNGGYVHDEKTTVNGDMKKFKMEEVCDTDDTTTIKINKKLAILDGFLMPFSAVTNTRKLLSAKKTPNTMCVLNGLRVLSMFWVILGHSWSFLIGYMANPVEAGLLTETLSFQAIMNGTVSVDTFFVLSGFLVTYLTLKQMDKANGKLNWALYYFHRWWRLTPAYMAAMAIWALIFPHFGQMVMFDDFNSFTRQICRETWWTHPLYINNLYPWPNTLDSCFGTGWYLANDMQFYIISPLVLIILYKNAKAGMALIAAMMAVSLSSLFGLNWYYGYALNSQPSHSDHETEIPGQDTTYAKPYTRISTYLVGMIMGYIIYSLKGKRMKLPAWTVIVGWIVALGTEFAVLYGTWASYDRGPERYESVLYLTFFRVAWGVSIGWIIFACLNGYGGPIGVILDWKFWIPLGRLTYCAFLVHPAIIYAALLNNRVLFHVSYLSTSYFIIANIVFSYVAAVILSLVFEGPFMGLEKLMFGKPKTA